MSSFFNSGSYQAPGNATTAVAKAGGVTRLYGFHIVSGGTGGIVNLHNSSDLVTPWMTMQGTASTGRGFTFGEKGIVFPNGLTVIADSNVTTVLFNISQ